MYMQIEKMVSKKFEMRQLFCFSPLPQVRAADMWGKIITRILNEKTVKFFFAVHLEKLCLKNVKHFIYECIEFLMNLFMVEFFK